MRLLVDMNLTPRWVQYLIDDDFECVHWSSLGPIRATDATICAYAREHGFVIITNDLDFPQILAHTSVGKPSIVLLRGEPLVPEVRAPALFAAIAACREELESGAILTIDWSDRVRIRLLPLSGQRP